MLLAKIISADALSQRFIPEQSFGKILANYLPEIRGSSAFTGFSAYSAAKCYESRYGNGTCSKFLARDGLCLGRSTVEIPKMELPCNVSKCFINDFLNPFDFCQI